MLYLILRPIALIILSVAVCIAVGFLIWASHHTGTTIAPAHDYLPTQLPLMEPFDD